MADQTAKQRVAYRRPEVPPDDNDATPNLKQREEARRAVIADPEYPRKKEIREYLKNTVKSDVLSSYTDKPTCIQGTAEAMAAIQAEVSDHYQVDSWQDIWDLRQWLIYTLECPDRPYW